MPLCHIDEEGNSYELKSEREIYFGLDLITVCSKCKKACCWQGNFYCDDYKTAGALTIPRSTLEKWELESSHYWDEEE